MFARKGERQKHKRSKKKVKELEDEVFHLSEEVRSNKERIENEIKTYEKIKVKLEDELKTKKEHITSKRMC